MSFWSWTFVALSLPLCASTCGPCQHAGPASPADQPGWLQTLQQDKNDTINRIGYKGGVFDTPELLWTQTSWIQPQMHPYDRFFYDFDTHSYTVDRYLSDVNTRYGGIDSMLMWPTYTNIGIDDRNQFDLFRAMPGGLDGVKKVTQELRARGVQVLWPYNPWDTGTHREPLSDEDTFAALLKQTDGQGFNGDTMGFVPQSFWESAQKAGYPLAFEPEGGGTDDSLNWSTMGWGYYTYPPIPQVDRFKFITGGKFMTNICDRWAMRKTDNLQTSWFNGNGYESWENVWGTWNGIVPRDGEAIRRVATMLRFFGNLEGLLHSPLWEPHTPVAMQPGVFMSEFRAAPGTPVANGTRLWTVVNRGGQNLTGQQLWVQPLEKDSLFFDCYHGNPLTLQPVAPPTPTPPAPQGFTAFTGKNCYSGHGGQDIDSDQTAPINLSVAQCEARCDVDPKCSCVTFQPSSGKCWKRAGCDPRGFVASDQYNVFVNLSRIQPPSPAPVPAGAMALSFDLEADGFGCVVESASPASPTLQAFLGTMAKLTEKPLYSLDATWKYLPQTMVGISKTPVQSSAPSGMVLIPKNNFSFVVKGVEIEGDDNHGVDVQYPWEEHPAREHSHTMELGPFYMDQYPVTTAQYSEYLQATKYEPEDSYNYLKNWNGSTTPPDALKDVPVTYVSLNEARKYCAWANKGSRLPHSYEWQYAAQGTDGRIYPWGSDKDQTKFPKQTTGTTFLGPESVHAHAPAGNSPFGVSDLVGNVWQYTDEFQDDHTRGVILRGGSNYRPSGSHWYFPQALELNTHNKYFLMDDRYERAGTVGFRCVVDAA